MKGKGDIKKSRFLHVDFSLVHHTGSQREPIKSHHAPGAPPFKLSIHTTTHQVYEFCATGYIKSNEYFIVNKIIKFWINSTKPIPFIPQTFNLFSNYQWIRNKNS